MKILDVETYSGPVHVAWASVFMLAFVAVGLLLAIPNPWWFGAAYGIAFYHGREQRDAEAKRGTVGELMAPWQWHAKSQWDFWPVVVSCMLFGLIAEFIT